MVEAIIEERRPKMQEKGNEIARAREPKSETWYTKNQSQKYFHFVQNILKETKQKP
jgi:hypothetical protein